MSQAKRLFEIALNILLLLASAAVVLFIADQYSGRSISDGVMAFLSDRQLVGRDTSDALGLPSGTRAVVFCLSTACGACDSHAPVFRDIVSRVHDESPEVQVLAAFPQPRSEAEAYITKYGLPHPALGSADFSSLGVRVTPTALVIDDQGRISAVLRGKAQITLDRVVRALTHK
jgi:hypothetical protein